MSAQVVSEMYAFSVLMVSSFVHAIPAAANQDNKFEVVMPLPDESDSFETIRRKNKVYVDKTPILEKLLDGGSKTFYFTRPRKFGKTMFLKTVEKFFRGEEDLFENLEIYNRGNLKERVRKQHMDKKDAKWIRYPVIYLDFSTPDYSVMTTLKDFNHRLNEDIKYVASQYDIPPHKKTFELKTLIATMHRKFDLPIVFLVDEYDAPIQHALQSNKSELAKGIHSIFHELFETIEEGRAAGEVEWTFVTGISRFNMFTEDSKDKYGHYVDLTDNKEFAAALGFTEKEISTNFEVHIKKFAKSKNTTREEIMNELVRWYEGYKFSIKGKSAVMNPVSTIKCLGNQRFGTYWCTRGGTSYVINGFLRDKVGIDHFENLRIERENLFTMHQAETGEPPFSSFMLYSGYLTITNYDKKSDVCVLDYPNKEVKEFLSDQLGGYVVSENKSISELPEWSKQLKQAMVDRKIPETMEVLKRYGFPILHSNRGHSAVWDWGVSQRLHLIFNAASVKNKQGAKVATDNGTKPEPEGIIHIQTLELPINYVVEIECEKGVLEAIQRLISYARERLDSFKKAIDNQNEVYLVGMGFTESGRGELEDWVCLPYRQGELKFDEVQASSQDWVTGLRNTINPKNVSVT